MDELDIVSLAIGAFVIWLTFKYYWLRVLSCTLLLTAWGSFAIVAPIFCSIIYIREGEYFSAVITLLLCVPLGGIWSVGAHVAYKWYVYQVKFAGGFWQPWTAE
jgi:hypothetical protein